jgi:hypothetical protein
MWRSLISAVIVYGFGHPSLDSVRPTVFDRPFQAFYQEVNHVALESRMALRSLENMRFVREIKGYVWHRDG